MIVTAAEMKDAEERAFHDGITATELMKVAGKGVAHSIQQFFPEPSVLIVFCGKGKNGGDALIAASLLEQVGWKVFLRLAAPTEELSELTKSQLGRLKNARMLENVKTLQSFPGRLILLDGLFGIGLSGPPRGVSAEMTREMNELRRECGGFTVAVDLPSGLDAISGEVFDPCVRADLTVTLGAVKSGLVTDAATDVVGRLVTVPLPGISFTEGDEACVTSAQMLRKFLSVRDFDSYKGTYGRIGILAGSKGYLGAARLSSAAAVRAGGGLVTLYAPKNSYELLASTCIPEVMVHPVNSLVESLADHNDVLALGPGLGRKHDQELREIVKKSRIPCVVDADALNAVSTDVSMLSTCAGERLLTPHPGEMERLSPKSGRSRRVWARDFVERYPVTLLLKGSRTIVAQAKSPIVFNNTGNPGMGSGGMGDVLTGVCAALMGGGHSARVAGMLGAWLCGRAAEIAIFKGCDSHESLAATSVIMNLGLSARSLRAGDF